MLDSHVLELQDMYINGAVVLGICACSVTLLTSHLSHSNKNVLQKKLLRLVYLSISYCIFLNGHDYKAHGDYTLQGSSYKTHGDYILQGSSYNLRVLVIWLSVEGTILFT